MIEYVLVVFFSLTLSVAGCFVAKKILDKREIKYYDNLARTKGIMEEKIQEREEDGDVYVKVSGDELFNRRQKGGGTE